MPPKDVYVNKAFISLIESAANTLTFKELETGVSTFQKVGWIINRIEYWLDNDAFAELAASVDSLMVGITLSNKITTLDLGDAALVDLIKFNVKVVGAPATAEIHSSPWIHDFSNYPGGGLIVPPRPIYGAIHAGGFAAPAEAALRFNFRSIELKTEEYWELVEAYRLVE